jgi:hypothetical protein
LYTGAYLFVLQYIVIAEGDGEVKRVVALPLEGATVIPSNSQGGD